MFRLSMSRSLRKGLSVTKKLNSTKPEEPRLPLHYVMWNDIKDYVIKKAMYAKIGTGVVAAAAVLVYYVSKSGKGFEAILPPLDPPEGKVLEAFQVGKGMEAYEEEDMLAEIERPELAACLLKVLQPDISKQYAVIVGEIGCDKSTAIRKC